MTNVVAKLNKLPSSFRSSHVRKKDQPTPTAQWDYIFLFDMLMGLKSSLTCMLPVHACMQTC